MRSAGSLVHSCEVWVLESREHDWQNLTKSSPLHLTSGCLYLSFLYNAFGTDWLQSVGLAHPTFWKDPCQRGQQYGDAHSGSERLLSMPQVLLGTSFEIGVSIEII